MSKKHEDLCEVFGDDFSAAENFQTNRQATGHAVSAVYVNGMESMAFAFPSIIEHQYDWPNRHSTHRPQKLQIPFPI
jgi:hypothetical protein